MSIDLKGGLDPELDGAILEPPEIEGFGENHAFWIFDREGRFAILHQHINAPGSAYGGDPAAGWSGRAFGLMRFPRSDGTLGFSEGFIFWGDGELILAEILESPWLTSLQDADEHFLVRLRVGNDTVNIAGVTVASTFNSSYGTIKNQRGFTMSHGMARFLWDGEEAFGQIERSGFAPEARIKGLG